MFLTDRRDPRAWDRWGPGRTAKKLLLRRYCIPIAGLHQLTEEQPDRVRAAPRRGPRAVPRQERARRPARRPLRAPRRLPLLRPRRRARHLVRVPRLALRHGRARASRPRQPNRQPLPSDRETARLSGSELFGLFWAYLAPCRAADPQARHRASTPRAHHGDGVRRQLGAGPQEQPATARTSASSTRMRIWQEAVGASTTRGPVRRLVGSLDYRERPFGIIRRAWKRTTASSRTTR